MSEIVINDTLKTLDASDYTSKEAFDNACFNRIDPSKILAGQLLRLYVSIDETFIVSDSIITEVVEENSLLVSQVYLDANRNKKTSVIPIDEHGFIVNTDTEPKPISGFFTLADRDSPIVLISIEAASLFERYGNPRSS
jgi:hypothetical protein